jgi:hypothetical protein
MPDYESYNDKQIKHLELIQAVVTRLGNNGFLVKGWAITVAGALLGFAVGSTDWRLALVSWVPSVAFWGLDAYFLRSERLFRALYAEVRSPESTVEPFFMAATSDAFTGKLSATTRSDLSWRKTLRRPALCIFYLALLASAVGVALIVTH